MASEKGVLRVVGPFETSVVEILDAGMQKLASGTHSVSRELEPGIYRVIAQVPGSRDEKLVAVEPGQTLEVDKFDLAWDSVTPHERSRSKHEYQTGPAESFSHQTHATIGNSPLARLFLFIRTLGDARTSVPSFSLANSEGSKIVVCPAVGHYDLQRGWGALSVNLPAGMYQLEHEVPGLGQRAQAVFAEDGWETQMFVPWRETIDFAAANIQMAPKGTGFHSNDSWRYSRTEAALLGLADHKVVLPPGELQDFVYGKFENPLLGLIAAYALILSGTVNYDDLRQIAQNLRMLLPHSPDAAVLALLAELRGEIPTAEAKPDWPSFEVPPWFAIGTELILNHSARIKALCNADSWLGQVSMTLTTGSAWTRWDPSLKMPEALQRLQTEVDAALQDGKRRIYGFVNSLAEKISLATLHIVPRPAVLSLLQQVMTQGGPELVKTLEQLKIYDQKAAVDNYAEQLASKLAPQFALPLSIVTEAVRRLVHERFSVESIS